MAFTWLPQQETLAKASDAALIASLASSRNWIVSGLALGVPGSGLEPTISTGTAWIDGYVATLASETITVTDDDTSTVYLGLTVDGFDNVTGVALSLTIPSSGYYVTLGTVTAASGDITGVATTGRSPETQADPIPTDADQIDYDNATSGLTATDVQEAVDELAARPASSIIIAGKNADQTFNSGTTRATITGLTASLEANSSYCFEVDMHIQNNSAAGIRLGATVPSGATGNLHTALTINLPVGLTPGNGVVNSDNASYNANIDFVNAVIYETTSAMCKMIGYVATSSTAGTLTIQGARQASAGSVVIRKGAILKLIKL